MEGHKEINPENIKEVKALRIDVLRIEQNKRKLCLCEEPEYTIDEANRLVTCCSCFAIVDPYDAILKLTNHFAAINLKQERMAEQRNELAQYYPHLKVLKELEARYRGFRYRRVPSCKHCGEILSFEDLVRTQWKDALDNT